MSVVPLEFMFTHLAGPHHVEQMRNRLIMAVKFYGESYTLATEKRVPDNRPNARTAFLKWVAGKDRSVDVAQLPNYQAVELAEYLQLRSVKLAGATWRSWKTA